MIWILFATALVLLSACEKNKGAADAAAAPSAFRAPSLKCTLLTPSGWTQSASTMPDHIAEVIANAPNLRGRMVVREALEPTVAAAAEAVKQRTLASWGALPDLTLLREEAMGEGRLLAYQWKPQPSAPLERHLVAVLPYGTTVVVAFIDDDGATAEAHLLSTLSLMKCSPK